MLPMAGLSFDEFLENILFTVNNTLIDAFITINLQIVRLYKKLMIILCYY